MTPKLFLWLIFFVMVPFLIAGIVGFEGISVGLRLLNFPSDSVVMLGAAAMLGTTALVGLILDFVFEKVSHKLKGFD